MDDEVVENFCVKLEGVEIGLSLGTGTNSYRAKWNGTPVTAVILKGTHPINIFKLKKPHVNILDCYGYFVKDETYYYIFEYFEALLTQAEENFLDSDESGPTINEAFLTVYRGSIGCLSKLRGLNKCHGHLVPANVTLTYGINFSNGQIKKKIENVKLMGIQGLADTDTNLTDDYHGVGRIVERLIGLPKRYAVAMDFLRRLSIVDKYLFQEGFLKDPVLMERHPMFWAVTKSISFICAVAEVLTKYALYSRQEKVNNPEIDKSGALFTSGINKIPIYKWKEFFPDSVKELKEVQDRQERCTGDYTRTLRNCSAHSMRAALDQQLLFGRHPDKYYRYFKSKKSSFLDLRVSCGGEAHGQASGNSIPSR